VTEKRRTSNKYIETLGLMASRHGRNEEKGFSTPIAGNSCGAADPESAGRGRLYDDKCRPFPQSTQVVAFWSTARWSLVLCVLSISLDPSQNGLQGLKGAHNHGKDSQKGR
jgi:hypothetical protein